MNIVSSLILLLVAVFSVATSSPLLASKNEAAYDPEAAAPPAVDNYESRLAAPPADESRTEDDGWVEGDYEGSLEEQEEQAQEDWEDAGSPGENDNDDDDNESDEELYECPDGSLVPLDTARCPNLSEQELKDLEEAILNDRTAPYWLPACDGSYQDCVTENGDVCVAESTEHEC